jgi:hypothetical protein
MQTPVSLLETASAKIKYDHFFFFFFFLFTVKLYSNSIAFKSFTNLFFIFKDRFIDKC